MKKRLAFVTISILLSLFLTDVCLSSTLLPYPRFKATDSGGVPYAGGKVYTYRAGTSYAKVSYSDRACTTANANPVVLDANGEATIYLKGNYKIILKTSADVAVWTLDNVQGMGNWDAGCLYADASEVDQGVTGSGNTIKALVDSLGSNKGSICLTHVSGASTTYTVSTDLTIADGITLRIDEGAILSVGAGKTLTVNGWIDAGPYQIFSGAGTSSVSTEHAIRYQAWWGYPMRTDIYRLVDANAEFAANNQAVVLETAIDFTFPVWTLGAGYTGSAIVNNLGNQLNDAGIELAGTAGSVFSLLATSKAGVYGHAMDMIKQGPCVTSNSMAAYVGNLTSTVDPTTPYHGVGFLAQSIDLPGYLVGNVRQYSGFMARGNIGWKYPFVAYDTDDSTLFAVNQTGEVYGKGKISTDTYFVGPYLHLLDIDSDAYLILTAGSDLSVNRQLVFNTGDAARSITLTGDPTMGDYFDQAVKSTSTVAFGGGSANKAMCWKADGKTLGYCSSVVDAAGACTCN